MIEDFFAKRSSQKDGGGGGGVGGTQVTGNEFAVSQILAEQGFGSLKLGAGVAKAERTSKREIDHIISGFGGSRPL